MKKYITSKVKTEITICDHCSEEIKTKSYKFNKYDNKGNLLNEYEESELCVECVESILRTTLNLPQIPPLICDVCDENKALPNENKCAKCLEEIRGIPFSTSKTQLVIYDKI